jgi:hypothetical protein
MVMVVVVIRMMVVVIVVVMVIVIVIEPGGCTIGKSHRGSESKEGDYDQELNFLEFHFRPPFQLGSRIRKPDIMLERIIFRSSLYQN